MASKMSRAFSRLRQCRKQLSSHIPWQKATKHSIDEEKEKAYNKMSHNEVVHRLVKEL